MMELFIDADGCPVTGIAVKLAAQHQIPCTLICDTAHQMDRPGARTIVVSKGADSVDFTLVNLIRPGDLVVTQDYGVAAMALGRGARGIHQSGMLYTEENIDRLLMERHLAQKARMSKAKHHLKGPKKRTKEDDERFRQAFEQLIREI